MGGAIVYADGRVVPVGGPVYTVSDRGTAAGATYDYKAELWLGC
jgi:hypothetical protein